jgi:hypothetical protein
MKLSEYKFPEITAVDLAFPTFNTIPELLEEAKSRNISKGRSKFSELFYSGGEIKFQKDFKDSWKEKAFIYAKALMGSWNPKHEEKEAVCAMIFEETLILK